MRIIYAHLEDLKRKLKSKRARKRMGKWKAQAAHEKLWLASQKHHGTPGYAR